MPFVIDDIIGLVGLAVAIPGLVQAFVHASRWLSKKLQEAPLSLDKQAIEDFLLSVDCGTIRATLETIEDICIDTSDENLRATFRENAETLWPLMLELEKQIRKMKADSSNDKQAKRAREKAVKAIESLLNLETHLRAQSQNYVNSHSLRSRFELRDISQITLIGGPNTLPYSAVSAGRAELKVKDWNGEYRCVLEQKTYRVSNAQDAYARAVELARSMQFFEANNGLLDLVGFYPLPCSGNDRPFQFVFAFPKDRVNPRSLRDILLDPINTPYPPIPRNYRFILPRVLAEAVYRTHEQRLVHKSIRPESILLFEAAPGNPGQKYPQAIGLPKLTDWNLARRIDHTSRRGRVDDWTLAMYQHPDRQALPGEDIEVKYHIGHDIYSLGVCLLEIGSWTSFIVYENNVPQLSPIFQDAKQRWRQDNSAIASSMEDAQIEQKVYIMLAEGRLAYEMGEAYSSLVVKCLSCVEKGFGNVLMFVNHESRDWEEQGTLFAQEIRRSLQSASVMGSGIYNTL